MLPQNVTLRTRKPEKQGNRLTRRPCKGDEFEILILEAKRQNAGICRSRQKMLATWTFISIGRRVTQEWKFTFRLRGDSILLFKGQKKRNLWFSIIRIISGRHSLFQFFPLLDASGARALVATQKPQSATRQRCDAMSSSRPKCTFFCARFGFFFCGASTEVAIFSSVSMFHPFAWVPATMVLEELSHKRPRKW